MNDTNYPPPKEITESKMEVMGKGFRSNAIEHLN